MRLPTDKKPYRVYAFFSNGSCIYYLRDRQGRLAKYSWGDDVRSHTWYARGNTLSFDGNQTTVLFFSPDSIVLRALDTDKTAILTRNSH